jgi:integrase
MTWRDVAGDTIRVVQQKTGAKLTITLHPSLQEILAGWPRTQAVILATEYGKAFSVKGWGNFMSDAIRAAELPERCKAHGLRKAAARRLAEAGCPSKEIMAVTGHKSLEEVERYTRAADQVRLNRQAIERQVGNSRVANRAGHSATPPASR